MVDNFELIKPLLKFEEEGNFYFVQVIQRKKDHKEENIRLGRNNNARLIKAFYVKSLEQLEEYRLEMIQLAQIFNARIGINLNPRNERKIALEMMEQLAHCIKSENYHVAKLYNSCCGASLGTDKTWVLDIDSPQLSKDSLKEEPYGTAGVVTRVKNTLKGIEPLGVDKIIAEIPTKNGVHIITRPFNSKTFGELHPDVQIHKNNPTVLYVP